MNDAPIREPLIIANVSVSVSTPSENSVSAIAATGDPLSTMYDPSHPKPTLFAVPSMLKSSSSGFRPPAPAFSNSSARMKIAMRRDDVHRAQRRRRDNAIHAQRMRVLAAAAGP